MSTILAANLRALERRCGAAPLLPDASPRVRAGDGGVEVHTAAGRWVRLHSTHDPAGEAARWAQVLLADSPRVIVIVGLGLGFLLDELERREGVEATAGTTRIVALEPEASMARRMLSRRDWTRWIDSGRLALLLGPSYAGLAAVAASVDVERARLVTHPVIERAWPDDCRLASSAVARLRFEASANAGAKTALQGRYLRHTLANAARIAREGDAARLDGIARGLPAIITAAGPSLDRNLHDLHHVRDRAIRIACDTAARPMFSAGLDPHFIVALDPSVANACHLGALHEPARTWLVAEGSLHPSAFTHFDDHTFVFKVADHEPWPWLRAAGLDRTRLDVWGSVISAAFSLAVGMGCSPIVFAGADLAFTDGRPYCRGTTLEPQWASWVSGGDSYERAWALLMDRWPVVHEADVRGTPVRTAPHLIAFRDWLVEQSVARDGIRIVNATAGGILRGGRIEQGPAHAALASAPLVDAAALDARVRLAHHGDPAARVRLFEAIAAIDARSHSTIAAHRAALAGPEFTAWALAMAEPALRG